MTNINIANNYDLQSRATKAELHLSIERTKLQQEKRKASRLQTKVNEYHETLTRCMQVGNGAMSQCQYLSNINHQLSQEIQRQRIVIGTLQAVIQKITTHQGDGREGTAAELGDDDDGVIESNLSS